MIETLKKLIPTVSHFEERIFREGDRAIGHQSVLITDKCTAFSGGTATDLNQARRICAAEAIERAYFRKLIASATDEHDPFLIRSYPTSCGFAAGFELKPTIFRSVCEAVERWAWSQWIDLGYQLPKAVAPDMNDLDRSFSRSFDQVLFFEKPIALSPENLPVFVSENFIFRVVIGIKDKGIFPGSRVTTAKDNSWGHPLLEAWRHQQIFAHELQGKPKQGIIDQRIAHFGNDGSAALKKISALPIKKWTTPRLRISKEVVSKDKYFVWRSLCHEFKGWEVGDVSRFVY